jgi:hypothetical protein
VVEDVVDELLDELDDDVDAARCSSLHAASVARTAAVPVARRRNARRSSPVRRALRSASSSVRRIVSSISADLGSGAYSPFDSGWNVSGMPGSSLGGRTPPSWPPGATGAARSTIVARR